MPVLQFDRHRLTGVGLATRDHDGGAALCIGPTHLASEPAAAPGHHGDLPGQIDDDEKADNISAEDKKELQDIVDETLDWMDENPEAEKEDYDGKQKEVENIANPIMRNFYAGAGGAGAEDEGDFGDDEL